MKEEINVDEILSGKISIDEYGNIKGYREKLIVAIKEIAEKLLEQAAENAEAIEGWSTGFSGCAAQVDKSSITDTIKQLKL